MNHSLIGRVNNFTVSRETKSGFYIIGDDDQEVFLPPSLGPLKLKIGQELDAFVYLDTQGDLIATTDIPYAQVGEYALLRAIDTQDFGAFFDWGIDKDLLVPGNEQKVKVSKFEDHIVRICIEEGTDRVYGTTKLGKYIEASEYDFKEKDTVSLVPARETELGYRCIINKKFIGMIYHNEIFEPIKIGETYQAVVKKLRPDGLVDVSLQAQGFQRVDKASQDILEMLERNGGKSDLHDKSSPDEIRQVLNMSKKTFKNAIGILYKERKIVINKDGIEQVNNTKLND